MKTINLAGREVIADRLLDRAAHECAKLFFGESFDDYAASVLKLNPDGSTLVQTATGLNTWNALACAAQDYGLATKLADMRIPDEWTTLETLEGSIRSRQIEDESGTVRGYLFKR